MNPLPSRKNWVHATRTQMRPLIAILLVALAYVLLTAICFVHNVHPVASY